MSIASNIDALASRIATEFNTVRGEITSGGGSLTIDVSQTGHGFSAGDVLKFVDNASPYQLAQADSAPNAEVVGIVSSVADANNFTLQIGGIVEGSAVPTGTQGDVVFLSPSVAGGTTTTRTTTAGEIAKPIGILIDSGNSMRWVDFVGVEIGGVTSVSRDKSFTIESPTDSESITLWRTNVDLTITAIHAVSIGITPSLTYTIRFASSRSTTGIEVVTGGSTTTSTTSGNSVTLFDDATIPAGSWIWIETTAQTGTVDQTTFTINYDE
jgi:hypothetical protein